MWSLTRINKMKLQWKCPRKLVKSTRWSLCHQVAFHKILIWLVAFLAHPAEIMQFLISLVQRTVQYCHLEHFQIRLMITILLLQETTSTRRMIAPGILMMVILMNLVIVIKKIRAGQNLNISRKHKFQTLKKR
jgi:hypothetical protein